LNIGKAKAAASPGAWVVPNPKPGTIELSARLLYGTGMRLMECVRLRVKDVLFEENQILVRDGKGAKDRVTMLPASVKAGLETHLERVKFVKRGTKWSEA